MQILIVIILVIAVLLVIFTLQNSIEVSIQLFFWEIANAPLVLVLLSCLALGYLVALIYFYPRFWKLKREYNQMIKFNAELNELHSMNHPGKKRDNAARVVENPEGDEMAGEDDTSFFND